MGLLMVSVQRGDNYMKTIAVTIGLVACIGLLWYGGFQLSRWMNYKFAYQLKVQVEVQKQLAPLEQRVAALEKEIKELKK